MLEGCVVRLAVELLGLHDDAVAVEEEREPRIDGVAAPGLSRRAPRRSWRDGSPGSLVRVGVVLVRVVDDSVRPARHPRWTDTAAVAGSRSTGHEAGAAACVGVGVVLVGVHREVGGGLDGGSGRGAAGGRRCPGSGGIDRAPAGDVRGRAQALHGGVRELRFLYRDEGCVTVARRGAALCTHARPLCYLYPLYEKNQIAKNIQNNQKSFLLFSESVTLKLQ